MNALEKYAAKKKLTKKMVEFFKRLRGGGKKDNEVVVISNEPVPSPLKRKPTPEKEAILA